MKKNSSKDLNLSNNEKLFLETSSIFDPKKYTQFEKKITYILLDEEPKNLDK